MVAVTPLPAPLPTGPIVLYDGVCGLCDRTVQWLIARDPDRVLHFAPLQGDTAAALRTRHASIPTELSTVVVIDHDRVYLRTKAILQAARYVGRPWRWGRFVQWMPSFLIDLPYRLVARVRYRIWGRHDACRIPTAADRSRFLP
ncbi:MAG: DCC1-like thiol-disulfide oxidoreductase family protein [Deltaproteobacteria bacterium]|nr:DCC1-like thiol-disulfide oxidoreductase family protein [Deltaproteobacteria bacterium]